MKSTATPPANSARIAVVSLFPELAERTFTLATKSAYQSKTAATVSCSAPSPTKETLDAPVASAETRYAIGTRSAAKKSELFGMRNDPSRKATVIHESVATTTSTTIRSTFACAMDAQGAGMKKNGKSAAKSIVDQYAFFRASCA